MKKSKKIGFYGGSFDPIHLGHIHLAIEISEQCGLDEVWFCPAALSPHKIHQPPVCSGEKRLEMVSLAIQGIPSFKPLDVEVKRGGVSYTIDTVRKLKESLNETDTLFLLLSQNAIIDFVRWKDWEQLLSVTPLLVGEDFPLSQHLLSSIPPLLEEEVDKGKVSVKRMEISSTEVRERLKKGLYCGHLVPAKVLDYIYRYRLYS